MRIRGEGGLWKWEICHSSVQSGSGVRRSIRVAAVFWRPKSALGGGRLPRAPSEGRTFAGLRFQGCPPPGSSYDYKKKDVAERAIRKVAIRAACA